MASMWRWGAGQVVWLTFLVCVQLQITLSTQPTWTFKVPDQSYIDFLPSYTATQYQRLGLSFRTHLPNALLLYHSLDSFNFSKFPLLQGYELKAMLQQGILYVKYRLNQYANNFVIGRNLNDNAWHKLELSLDIRTGGFAVSVDRFTPQQQQLIAFQQHSFNVREVLTWSKLSSVISYGGTSKPVDFDYDHFIGCMKNLKYENSSERYIDIPVRTAVGVVKGCLDLCAETNLCKHNSTCVNRYTHSTCECFGTDYEGEFCESEGATTVTLKGYEWLTYQLYDDAQEDLPIQISRISMEFKTNRDTGLLLYAAGRAPRYSHITVSLHSGLVNVSISSDNRDWLFSVSIEMDVTRWHNLTLVHRGSMLEIHLDGQMKMKDVENYLNLDPHVYFGGGNNFVKTKGLMVTQNFVGCLRNVYFNDKSVLYELKQSNGSTQYHGGQKIQYGCFPIQEIPLTFPEAGTMLLISDKADKTLDVQFDFRTVRSNGMLFYVGLKEADRKYGYIFGHLKVMLWDGRPNLIFIVTTKSNFSQNLSLPFAVNDNRWHSMHLIFKDSQPKLTVDSRSVIAQSYTSPLRQRKKIVIGYTLRRTIIRDGFVGCVKNIRLQGRDIDPISVIHTTEANGLKLDGCNLIDYCKNNSICKHGARCLSDWDDMHCDCSSTDYEGKACHFAKNRKTCDEYYQSGERQSGVYKIDVDGNGPLSSIYTRCRMVTGDQNGSYGETVVQHNLKPNTTVRSFDLPDFRKVIRYREMDSDHLKALTYQSAQCEQYLEYDCYDLPLRLAEKLWFKAANGEVVEYLGSSKSGECACAKNSQCSDPLLKCNCDYRVKQWQKDAGYNRIAHQLPITEINAEQDSTSPEGLGRITLGCLKCWGSIFHDSEKSMTFKTASAYMRAPAWRTGDLKFSFRTHEQQALILHQTDGASNEITIKLVSGEKMMFQMVVEGNLVEREVVSTTPLSSGLWNLVELEHDEYNIRLTVGTIRQLFDLDSNFSKVLGPNGQMYIGGLPNTTTVEHPAPGLIGCIRDLVYNGKFTDVSQFDPHRSPDIKTGCLPACWDQPCKNGGTCVEKWGSYECICKDKWAHLGHNCENNINEDAVTFSSNIGSFLFFNKTNQPEVLDGTIVLSFRTRQDSALLLYAHDAFGNFVQLELQNGRKNKVVISFNSYNRIESQFIEADVNLADENWHQIVAEIVDGNTRLILEGKSKMIKHKRFKKQLQDFRNKTSITPYLSRKSGNFTHLYVGGVPPNMSSIQKLNGCIRGLKMGLHIVKLQERANMTPEVFSACKRGCRPHLCKQNVSCTNMWQNGEFLCDCEHTMYYGKRCDRLPCVVFDGKNILDFKFDPARFASKSTTKEKLSVHFETNSTSKQNLVLVDVHGSRQTSFIVIYMVPGEVIVLKTNQGVGNYVVRQGGNFSDGRMHHVEYSRNNENISLSVDGEKTSRTYYYHYSLEGIHSISVGGPNKDRMGLVGLDLANFSGYIHDVSYMPLGDAGVILRPLKTINNSARSKFEMTQYGSGVDSCSDTPKLMVKTSPNSLPTVAMTVQPNRTLTMPPWPSDEVTTTFLGTSTQPSTALSSKISMTSPRTNRSIEIPIFPALADDMTIVIVVGLIIGGILLSAIIAVILVRYRKKKDSYVLQKNDDVEMKEPLHPLNHMPPSSPALVMKNNHNNHIATFDEFSMLTAMLNNNANVQLRGQLPPGRDPKNRFSHSSIPWIDDESSFVHPIYNRKKKRPASSISEVLEEIERQRKAKELGLDPDADISTPSSRLDHVIDESQGSEWDPHADKTPLTADPQCVSPLAHALSTLDEYEEYLDKVFQDESSVASSQEERGFDDSLELRDSWRSEEESLDSHGQQSVTDHNGDSGYEASSKPEGDDENTADNTADTISPGSPDQKFSMYDVNGIVDHELPVEMNTAKQKLLEKEIAV